MDKPKVVKLAQPGFDVKTAGDENLIYNSNWPLLKIVKQGVALIPSGSKATLIAHDLGYTPMFWLFADGNISDWIGSTYAVDRRSEFFGAAVASGFQVDSGKLACTTTVSGDRRVYYYIFAIDLTKQFTAPIIKVGNISGDSDDAFVFKIAKEGKDISSKNLDDYVVHSRARSPLVHSVNPGVVNIATSVASERKFEVIHNLGYAPMFFAYTKNTNGSYSMLPTSPGGAEKFDVDEKVVRFREGASGRNMTIVILKDPFVIDYTVRVNT